MIVQCERCKVEKECRFVGKPADVEEGKHQDGMWICEECVQPMTEELDRAIQILERFTDDDETECEEYGGEEYGGEG